MAHYENWTPAMVSAWIAEKRKILPEYIASGDWTSEKAGVIFSLAKEPSEPAGPVYDFWLLANFLKEKSDPDYIRTAIDAVEFSLLSGNFDDAITGVRMFENNQAYLREQVLRLIIEKQSIDARRAGATPKRRPWAEYLGDRKRKSGLSFEGFWATIPLPGCELEEFAWSYESAGVDLYIYRDSDAVVAVNQETRQQFDMIRKSTLRTEYCGRR